MRSFRLVLCLLLVLAPREVLAQCGGVERWPVKVGSDSPALQPLASRKKSHYSENFQRLPFTLDRVHLFTAGLRSRKPATNPETERFFARHPYRSSSRTGDECVRLPLFPSSAGLSSRPAAERLFRPGRRVHDGRPATPKGARARESRAQADERDPTESVP